MIYFDLWLTGFWLCSLLFVGSTRLAVLADYAPIPLPTTTYLNGPKPLTTPYLIANNLVMSPYPNHNARASPSPTSCPRPLRDAIYPIIFLLIFGGDNEITKTL